ncbi:MAG TPA: MBL fold metallo-hydrolase [Aestuariivirgaceae bacterium]|jgi:glyoxylase-like metal-dependent hydrolase (beta-lactamase superfamily II)|nr:MBL fold metallo-hydrolase [Aestuariivirgaceae bacterium]
MPQPQAIIIPVTPFQQNCSVIWDSDSKEAAVVDPGGDVDQILKAIQSQAVKPSQILLTHGHIDHAGGAEELAEKLGVPVIGPNEEDVFLLQSLALSGQQYGMDARNCKPSLFLKQGDEIKIGGLTFEVRECPGHTPGHVVFFDRAHRLAIVGDVIFQGSIGRTDLPRGNHETLIKSIREQIIPMGDDVAFLCGHGNPSTVGRERQSNPFLV